MNAVHTPLVDSQGLNYTSGVGGYPAFLFTDKSNVHAVLSGGPTVYPRLWSDFSLSAEVRPVRPRGGFLLAVVSPSGTVVLFGLRIADGDPDSSKVRIRIRKTCLLTAPYKQKYSPGTAHRVHLHLVGKLETKLPSLITIDVMQQ